jgi:tRNA-(MS[2]IO[6]A)-hydroxylase (MiaE)-like
MTEPSQRGGLETPNPAFEDPAYAAAVVDLLGAIAYGEISAFERLAQDARMAPDLADKAELARMAATEFSHYQRLHDYLQDLGADPMAAMAPFATAFDAFHVRTASSDWLEGLVTAYVGDGLAADFYTEIAALLDPDTRTVVVESLADAGSSEFVVERVRAAITKDHRVAGRLALWGRRLMGEALSQAQRVAAERDALTALLAGGVDRPGMDLAALGRLFTRLTENHTKRMSSLGLDA